MTDQTFIYRLFLVHLMANQLTFAVLVSRLYKSELPPLTVKMARAWKKKKKEWERERRHHPSSLWLPFASAFLKVTGRSVFLLTHQYFRALHMECSSDFEYRACAYISSLFLSDMTSSNAHWKLKSSASSSPPPFRFPNKICERIAGRCWSLYKIKCRETQRKYWICVEDWYRR